MKLRSLLFLALSAPMVLRAEVVELTTLTGKTYHQCRIVKIDTDGVVFRHTAGAGKVLFKDMTRNWRDHFGYDPVKAKAHEDKVATERKKAREIAQAQAYEAAKLRQAAYERQRENQALVSLQNALAQSNAGYLANGWIALSGGLPSHGIGATVDGRGYYQAGKRCPTGLPFAGTRYFNTGCQPNFNVPCNNGFTPRPFFAVPGVGINVAPQGCAPAARCAVTTTVSRF